MGAFFFQGGQTWYKFALEVGFNVEKTDYLVLHGSTNLGMKMLKTIDLLFSPSINRERLVTCSYIL